MKKRMYTFNADQFKELAANPKFCVAVIRAFQDDPEATTATAFAVARATLKQYELFEAGQRLQFDAFEVAQSDSLSDDELSMVADGSAKEVNPPVDNPLPDDLTKSERKYMREAIAAGIPMEGVVAALHHSRSTGERLH